MRAPLITTFVFALLGCAPSNDDPAATPSEPSEPQQGGEADAGPLSPAPGLAPTVPPTSATAECTVTELGDDHPLIWHEVRDASGRLVMEDLYHGKTLDQRVRYAYDDAHRLVAKDDERGLHTAFSYEAGLMTMTLGDSSATYAVDGEGRIVSGPSADLTYDSYGFVHIAKIGSTDPHEVWTGTWTSANQHIVHYTEDRYGGARCDVDWLWYTGADTTIVTARWGSSVAESQFDRCVYKFDADSQLEDADCTSPAAYEHLRVLRQKDGSTIEEVTRDFERVSYRFSPSCKLGLGRNEIEHSILGIAQLWDPRARLLPPARPVPGPNVSCFPDWGSI